MKYEQQYQEPQSRTIQSKKDNNSRFSFVDNRDTVETRLVDTIQRIQEQASITTFVDNRDTTQMKLIQCAGMEDEELQMKSVAQLESEDDELLQGKFETIQMRPSVTVSCTATVNTDKGTRVALGCNSGARKSLVLGVGDAGKVVAKFQDYRLLTLGSLKRAPKGNPPGACAEPHAVANALDEIHDSNAKVNHIHVTQSKDSHEKVKPRCDTCKKWIPETTVKAGYLEQTPVTTVEAEGAPVVPDTTVEAEVTDTTVTPEGIEQKTQPLRT